MRALNFEESIRYTLLGAELQKAFRDLRGVPVADLRRGNLKYDRWRETALQMNAIRGPLGPGDAD